MSKVKRVVLSYYTLDRYLVKMVKIDISKIMYGLVTSKGGEVTRLGLR